MPEAAQKLLLVGCGKMGGAMLRSIATARLASITVIEPSGPPAALKSLPDIQWKSPPQEIDPSWTPDIVLIAVKPQMIPDVLPAYAKYSKAVFLSIAAGLTLEKLSTILANPSAAIVRTMPNLPASIGQGMTAAVANRHVTAQQREICDRLMKAVGATAWIDDESLLDAVTALSGSGPAYVFALCEAMAKAGEALGLSADMANTLARQTIIGSGALLAAAIESAADLRRAVTSPKGTTEAALTKLLGENGLYALMQQTMAAAAQRSKELAR